MANLTFTAAERRAAYAARRFLGSTLEEKLKLRIPFDVYFQDTADYTGGRGTSLRRGLFRPLGAGIGDGPTTRDSP